MSAHKPNNKERLISPFQWHGVHFSRIPHDSGQATGTCVFCGKPDHFSMNVDNGLWDCKKCGRSGNVTTFLEQLIEHYQSITTKEDYKRLRTCRRGAAPVSAFKRSQFAWDGERWLFPVRCQAGSVQDVRIYKEGGGTEATKGCKVGLWGMHKLKNLKRGTTIIVCEGEHDGTALENVVFDLDLIDEYVVVAVPGATVFKQEWVDALRGFRVVLAYDADGAGDDGSKKAATLLRGVAEQLLFTRWSLDAPKGFDISDLIVASDTYATAWETFQSLLSKSPRTEAEKEVLDRVNKKRESWKPILFNEVRETYGRWYKLNDDNFDCLRYCLATVMSPRMQGDPLWSYIVAAAATGKTALINPFRSVIDQCTFRSTITKESLISGYDKNKNRDPGLFAEIGGKCLVIKDMTEVFGLPEAKQEELFGVLRGSFDGHADRSYGNDVYRKYDDLNYSILAGVTTIVHGSNRSHLGERMLKYQMIPYSHEESIDEEHAILRQAIENVGKETKMDAELSECVQRFLLIETDPLELKKVVSEKYVQRLMNAASLIVRFRQTVMRHRFKDSEVLFRPQTEMPNRVGKQLMKLATFLVPSSVDGKTFGDDEMRIIERVAFDTCIGWNLDVFQTLVKAGGLTRPVSIGEINSVDDFKDKTSVTRRIHDMEMMGMLRKETVKSGQKNKASIFYEASPVLKQLWINSGIEGDHRRRMIDARKGSTRVRVRVKKKQGD